MWKYATAVVVAAAALAPRSGAAQDAPPVHDMNQHDMAAMDMPDMDMDAMVAPLQIRDEREGSGTSWLPDESVMRAVMRHTGSWMWMTHGQLFLQAIDVSGARGSHQVGSINWLMTSASRPLAGGVFSARGMFSIEPLTVGRCGYPDLVQSGESCRGTALHDRQHPHDVLMEAAVDYRRAIATDVAVELYGAAVGEPALGPAAFPHRLSALPNPIAPISHHWLDATHVSFGVATAAVYGRRWKAEASAFNGREPDDARYDLDLGALDSYAARLSWLPSRRWALQVSTASLRAAEEHDGAPVGVQRTTASVIYHRIAGSRTWATTAAWGRNVEGDHSSQAGMFETSLDVTRSDTLFARAEVVQKTARDLSVVFVGMDDEFAIGKIQVGYARQLATRRGADVGVGASVGVAALPASLSTAYASRTPMEVSVFLTLRPGGRAH